MKKRIERLHLLFEITVLLKGLHAFLETVGGFFFLFVPTTRVNSVAVFLTSNELGEDPKDFLARYLAKFAGELSVSGQHFIALYLLSHGIVKLFAVIALWKRKLWAYPSSILIFALFIVYQTYRYASTHSTWLLVLSVFDILLILLTIREYKYIKTRVTADNR